MRKKRTFKISFKKPGSFDRILFWLTIGLTIFGVIMVYNASVVEAYRDFLDKYYYLKYQAIWAFLGTLVMISLSFFNYKNLKKLSPLLFIINIIFLILVLIPGIGLKIKGASRWLNFGVFGFQPAELIKLTLTLYLSYLFSHKKAFWQFIFLIGLVAGLVMLQPDLGTTIVILTTAFLLYFAAGALFLELLPLTLGGFLIGLLLVLTSPYRKNRLLTFLDPMRDPLGASYHIRQVLIALGSGRIFGVGLGQSRQKYEYLPESTTDSIFAIIAEETGFIGGAIVILVFLMVIYRGFAIAQNSQEQFSRLLATGITCWLGVQSMLNLGTMVALVPLTGVPLPFISYGGSSLIVTLAGIGILLNISRFQIIQKKKRKR
jgi:cell division protein FtsW